MSHVTIRRQLIVLAVALLAFVAVVAGAASPVRPGRPLADPGQVGCCSRGR